METNFISDRVFDKDQFQHLLKPGAEFDHCQFKSCDFSGLDLSGIKFIDCRFVQCNLSSLRWENTALREVHFEHCKILAARFDRCNAFGLAFGFNDCILDHSTFFKTQIKKTLFKRTRLNDCDFTESDLSQAVFDDCDLSGALFDHTRLEKADFRTAIHYQIDPENNSLKGARFSPEGLAGLLQKYQIRIG